MKHNGSNRQRKRKKETNNETITCKFANKTGSGGETICGDTLEREYDASHFIE